MNGSELKAKSELLTRVSEGQATGSVGGLALSRAILIAGPTASGKSALAMRLAKQCGGYIINSDSMQVYDVLDQLTARPQPDELQAVAHYLYGYVKPQQHFSTGRWLEDVQTVLQNPELQGRMPVFVGGTGLYFKALLGGLSDMPQIEAAVREKWRGRMADEGAAALHEQLLRLDPLMAARLKEGDSQRIVRALEVIDSTGRSLLDWQNQQGTALIAAEASLKLVVAPDRAWLHQRIAQRFALMMDGKAIEEVQALLQLSPDQALPVMKAIGVREIEAMLQGAMSREEAVEKAVIATRQYAKRQMTWFRNQLDDGWQRIEHADQYALSLQELEIS